MTIRKFRLVVAAVVIGVASAPLTAQSAAPVPERQTPWAPYLGCWSTSSSGVIGPMVCVVPTESGSRVEFMTVDGDSVITRTVVDASGEPRAIARGVCVGWEDARWSQDQRHLFMHADYKCTKGKPVRSDAVLSMTRSDAFTHVERVTSSDSGTARVVNFIVQLDTTGYPLEVRRRLTSYRALAGNEGELEAAAPALTPSDVMEAATMLDPAVVQAWLADRGEDAGLTARELRVLRVASEASNPIAPTRGQWVRSERYRSSLAVYRWRSTSSQPAFSTAALDWGIEPYNGRLITPDMVNFGVPYEGYQRGFTWNGWR